jgi:hypothetical protein
VNYFGHIQFSFHNAWSLQHKKVHCIVRLTLRSIPSTSVTSLIVNCKIFYALYINDFITQTTTTNQFNSHDNLVNMSTHYNSSLYVMKSLCSKHGQRHTYLILKFLIIRMTVLFYFWEIPFFKSWPGERLSWAIFCGFPQFLVGLM